MCERLHCEAARRDARPRVAPVTTAVTGGGAFVDIAHIRRMGRTREIVSVKVKCCVQSYEHTPEPPSNGQAHTTHPKGHSQVKQGSQTRHGGRTTEEEHRLRAMNSELYLSFTVTVIVEDDDCLISFAKL